MLKISLFGPLRLLYNDQPLKFAALPKTLPLFAYLLLHRAKPIPRTTLAFTHWPDLAEDEARSNLRRHLYELRRVLPTATEERPWLLTDNTSIQWNPAADYWCDVAAFEASPATPDGLAAAVQLYTADLLPELYDDWIFLERERLRNGFFAMLNQLIAQQSASGNCVAAIRYAQQILQHDPLREDVLRTLMSLRHESGDRAGALQEYQRFVQRLRQELDIAPMVETSALYDTIARHLPDLGSAPHPPPSLTLAKPAPVTPAPDQEESSTPHNLPAPLTSFIGRDEEVAGVRNLVSRSTEAIRLLTLTGPGGSGKTRLALEVGMRLATSQPSLFTHGIYLVGLDAVTDPALVLPAIATTLGVKEQGAVPLHAALKAWLRDKKILLLLDNVEQVADVAPLLADLLAAASQLTLLVTSRKLLSIYGEHEFPVLPLPLPDAEDWHHPEDLASYAAVTLFITRSRAVNPHFTLNRENAAAVAEICVRLDGLPLALELAAARSKLFTPQALLPQLGRGLDLLVGTRHGAAERQRTLRQTIDWSYHLLEPASQRLFVRLSVFVGEFTLAAAEAVLTSGNGAIAGERSDEVIEGLFNLLNQSMVQRIEPTHPEDTTLRFRLLLTLRDYAMAQLIASGEAATMQERHAHYYLAQMEQAASVQEVAKEGYWLDQMAAELDNLRAAFAWSRQTTARSEIAIRLAIAAANFWLKRGYLAEGQRWLEQALEGYDAVSPALQAKAFSTAGMLAWYQEAYGAAQSYLQRSLALWQTLGPDADQDALARVYLALGGIARQHDNYAAALQYHSAALAIQRTLNNRQGMADALHNLGVVKTFLGHYDAAQQCLEECYTIDCALGDQWGIFLDLNSWGVLDYLQGNYTVARTRLAEGLAIGRRLGAKTRLSLLLSHLGKVALAEANWDEANRCFQEALTIADEVGIKSQRFAAQMGLSLLLLQQGNDQRAFDYLTRSVTIWQEDRKPKELLALLDALAFYHIRHADQAKEAAHALPQDCKKPLEKALHLLGFAQTLRDQLQMSPREPIYLPFYEKVITTTHAKLSPDQTRAALAYGQAQTLDDVMQLLA
jgi:predicted ATPase/DNA-binding SARP family transcriptional activator